MSNLEKEISKAISSHFIWKAKLRKAIETGAYEYNVDNIKKDNLCDFGKWLYSLDCQDDVDLKNIIKLHADFHLVTANVLELALNGKIKEPKELIDAGSIYQKSSQNLTIAMIGWREKQKE